MARRKRKEAFEDDGRVIAPMNVEGMPWYVKGQQGGAPASNQPDYLSPKERRQENRLIMWGVMKAALLVGLVFIIGYALILLVFTWFVNR